MKKLALAIVLFVSAVNAYAQNCLHLSFANDTLYICAPESKAMPISISGQNYVALDTIWGGLGTYIGKAFNPMFSDTATEGFYSLSIKSLATQNVVLNGDFSLGNQSFQSNYQSYLSAANNMMPASNYFIGNNPNAIHPDYLTMGDHTSGTGNMFICNASDTPNIVVWQQTISVVPHTDYDFSTWVATVLNTDPNPAQLQFSINGVLIGPVFTANASGAIWEPFHAIWNSGTTTSAIISIINQNTIDEGNDFALDDIAFNQYCLSTDSFYLKVNKATSSVTKSIGCTIDSVHCVCNGVGAIPSSVHWSFGDGHSSSLPAVSHAYALQGTYSLVLTYQMPGCPSLKDTTYIDTHHPLLQAGISLSANPIDIKEVLYAQSNSIGNITNYEWYTGDNKFYSGNSLSHIYKTPGTYTITHIVSDTMSCTDTATVELTVTSNTHFLVPSAFSPNGDGVNDVFRVVGNYEQMNFFDLSVYNRWGQLQFQTNAPTRGWDGTFGGIPAELGTYYWYLDIQFNGQKEATKLKGDVTLMR